MALQIKICDPHLTVITGNNERVSCQSVSTDGWISDWHVLHQRRTLLHSPTIISHYSHIVRSGWGVYRPDKSVIWFFFQIKTNNIRVTILVSRGDLKTESHKVKMSGMFGLILSLSKSRVFLSFWSLFRKNDGLGLIDKIVWSKVSWLLVEGSFDLIF